ncbi:MAG: DNA integrity scanning protein DisA nucleotide-binding domain protein [Clostridia bacterium]|nr:DNA integrity scanning protein DisA nucleotide-binding domain protein [Clostridia bacterium]
MDWEGYVQKFKTFGETFGSNVIVYILEFIMLAILFYFVFKVLQVNKSNAFIAVICTVVVVCGFAFSLTDNVSSSVLLLIIIMMAILIFTMYSTEIKRQMLDAKMSKTRGGRSQVDLSGINVIIEEIIKAMQNMSKNDIGALIVLSDNNLPEGIIESGTVINADITDQMIEAVFYPKAPLHDGAMVIEGDKIYAAGCFLPIAQSDNLPKEMGSRHRAALGVTAVASVTAMVVSEETGIISIVKNGVVRKKYADANDIRNALSDYYWSALTAEAKE